MNLHPKCEFCDSKLDVFLHGNRHYCDNDNECYNMAKKVRSHEKYQSAKDKVDKFLKADRILKDFYAAYGSECYIPSDLLESVGFDWTVCTGTTLIDKVNVTLVYDYGFALFKNNTIRIWKAPMK